MIPQGIGFFYLRRHVSSNVDEAIKTILSSFIFLFFLIFFNEEILHAQNAYKRTKTKKAALLYA